MSVDQKQAASGRRPTKAMVRAVILGLVLLVLTVALAWGIRHLAVNAGSALGYALAWLAALGVVAIIGFSSGAFGLRGPLQGSTLLEAVADAADDAQVVTDRRGRAVHANRAFLELAAKAGISRSVGLDVLYSGYPDFAEPVYQLAQAAREGKPLYRDIRVAANSSVPGASADGPRWLRISVAPVQGMDDTTVTLWRLTDITADRQNQESAFARLQFIITYLDHAPAGFFSTLPNGRVDYVNATLAEWLGLDLAAAQGGKLTLDQLVGPEAATLLQAVAPVKSSSRVDRFKVSLPTASGASIAAEVVHRADFDEAAKPLPFRSMVLRKDAAEKKSRTVEGSWFDMLSTAAPLGLAVLSGEGIITRANVNFLNLSPQLKLHGGLVESVRASDREATQEAFGKCLAARGQPQQCEVLLDDAVPRAVQLTFCSIASDGEEIAVFAIDRTESRTLEVQLAQSQKMQAVGQLASGIAHDFNNVLTPIIGFADLLLAKMRPTDAAFADIMNIKQNANRAANLVRQLLAFSRKQTMQPRVHLLSEAMSDLGNLLGRVLGEKIGLEINHARDLGYVLVDFNQFEQVIINLAVNARDAMPQGGTLTVKTYNLSREESKSAKHKLPEGDYVVCQVADSGSGIPKDILEKIWEPFFSTKEVGKGTGLGLAMVYGIVKQTGGFIYCDSEVGKGTVFSIFLPRHYPEKAKEAAPVVEKAAAVREDFTGRGRILVVEDEDSVRAFAVRALASRGYTVLEANSGESALEVIEGDKSGFELILSDVVMPEMDGPSLLAEMRKRGITTKVIFMSGYAEDAFERNLENPDDFIFLQKPFTLKQLVEKVKGVMR